MLVERKNRNIHDYLVLNGRIKRFLSGMDRVKDDKHDKWVKTFDARLNRLVTSWLGTVESVMVEEQTKPKGLF